MRDRFLTFTPYVKDKHLVITQDGGISASADITAHVTDLGKLLLAVDAQCEVCQPISLLLPAA